MSRAVLVTPGAQDLWGNVLSSRATREGFSEHLLCAGPWVPALISRTPHAAMMVKKVLGLHRSSEKLRLVRGRLARHGTTSFPITSLLLHERISTTSCCSYP